MTKRFLFALLLPFVAHLCSAQSRNPLRIPDTLTGNRFDLTVAPGARQFFPGEITRTSGVNGDFWGPTLIFNRGENVQLNVINRLGTTTTMHWHGFHIPAMMDGGPHQTIDDGTTWSPSFTVNNNAATYWYHPHLHMETEQQLTEGLGGLIIVRDAIEAALPLPRRYGIDDIPLVLTDRRFSSTNQLQRVRYGDTMLVNGTLDPVISLPAQVVRFRILDAATERSYNIGFADGRTFHVITSDGGLLDRPVPVTRYLLSVGERIEVLVDLSTDNGKSLTLRAFNSTLAQNIPGGEPVDFPGLGNRLGKRDFDILHIDVADPIAGGITVIPTTLVANTPLDPLTATNTRTIRMTDAPGNPPGFLLDGTPYDMNVINHRVPINTTEIWEIDNQSGFSHPFHIHLVEFNIISRNNGAVPEYERGWKDVVFVKAHEKARFVARFVDFADATHPYMYHCHIAAHEDEGMMGQFVVDPAPTRVHPEITDEHSLLVYPNPTGGSSTLLLPTGRTAASYQVFDPLGRIVSAGSALPAGAPLTLPRFEPGIYMIRVTDDHGMSLSTRFVVR